MFFKLKKENQLPQIKVLDSFGNSALALKSNERNSYCRTEKNLFIGQSLFFKVSPVATEKEYEFMIEVDNKCVVPWQANRLVRFTILPKISKFCLIRVKVREKLPYRDFADYDASAFFSYKVMFTKGIAVEDSKDNVSIPV